MAISLFFCKKNINKYYKMPSEKKICSYAGKALSIAKSFKAKSKAGTALANCRWHKGNPSKMLKFWKK